MQRDPRDRHNKQSMALSACRMLACALHLNSMTCLATRACACIRLTHKLQSSQWHFARALCGRRRPTAPGQEAEAGACQRAPVPGKPPPARRRRYRRTPVCTHSQLQVSQADSGRKRFCARIARQAILAQALGFSRAEVRGCKLLRVGETYKNNRRQLKNNLLLSQGIPGGAQA